MSLTQESSMLGEPLSFFKYYPVMYFSNIGLQRCTDAAFRLHHNLLMLSVTSSVPGTVIMDERTARRVGMPYAQMQQLLDNLVENGAIEPPDDAGFIRFDSIASQIAKVRETKDRETVQTRERVRRFRERKRTETEGNTDDTVVTPTDREDKQTETTDREKDTLSYCASEKDTPLTFAANPVFAKWWHLYPAIRRNGGVATNYQLWLQHAAKMEDTVLAFTEEYIECQDSPRFCKNSDTFLRSQNWINWTKGSLTASANCRNHAGKLSGDSEYGRELAQGVEAMEARAESLGLNSLRYQMLLNRGMTDDQLKEALERISAQRGISRAQASDLLMSGKEKVRPGC